MSPNPIIAMAPTNVQTTAVQGSPNSNANQQQQRNRTRPNTQVNGSPRHRIKSRNQRERNTPSPKNRGSPKPKTSIPSSSRRNYTPPPRFQKMGQLDGANSNNNYSSSSNFSDGLTSSDDNSNDSTKETYAGAKFHSEAPHPEALPMPPSSWLVGCSNRATTVSNPNLNTGNDYQQQLADELKCMLKVAL